MGLGAAPLAAGLLRTALAAGALRRPSPTRYARPSVPQHLRHQRRRTGPAGPLARAVGAGARAGCAASGLATTRAPGPRAAPLRVSSCQPEQPLSEQRAQAGMCFWALPRLARRRCGHGRIGLLALAAAGRGARPAARAGAPPHTATHRARPASHAAARFRGLSARVRPLTRRLGHPAWSPPPRRRARSHRAPISTGRVAWPPPAGAQAAARPRGPAAGR